MCGLHYHDEWKPIQGSLQFDVTDMSKLKKNKPKVLLVGMLVVILGKNDLQEN